MTNTPALSIAHLLGRPKQPTKAAPAARSKPAVQAKAAPRKVNSAPPKPARNPAATADFSHLVPAPSEEMPSVSSVKPPEMSKQATAILKAAAKRDTPTGTGAPKPTGLAARIIAAGRKRRGEA